MVQPSRPFSSSPSFPARGNEDGRATCGCPSPASTQTRLRRVARPSTNPPDAFVLHAFSLSSLFSQEDHLQKPLDSPKSPLKSDPDRWSRRKIDSRLLPQPLRRIMGAPPITFFHSSFVPSFVDRQVFCMMVFVVIQIRNGRSALIGFYH